MCSLLICSSMVFLLLPLCNAQSPVARNVDFHVGVVLDFDSPVGRIGNNCLWRAHSDFYKGHGDYITRLVLHPINSNGSVIDAAGGALTLLRDVKVDAIIGPQKSTQANFVMDLGDRAHVPIISFSATSPSLIHRTPYFFQTASSDADQVQAIASIVEEFKWSQVVIIYEDTEFGNGIIPYLSNALQDVNARVIYKSVLPKSASDDLISKELYKMMTMQTRVFVVHMSQFLGNKLFLKLRELRMMAKGYVWIVTSGITDLFNVAGSDVAEAMQGVIGVRPLIPKSKELQSCAETSIFGLWAYDTLWAVAMAAEKVGSDESNKGENKENVDSTSQFTFGVSEIGPKLLKALLETSFTGLSGEFNLVDGKLKQTAYQIINVVGGKERLVGNWTQSVGISRERNLEDTSPYFNSKENFWGIIWPGNSTNEPRGWEIPVNGRKLRIAVPQKSGFNDFLKMEIDKFVAVMNELPYAIPYEFIPYPFFNLDGSSAGSYDDLVYQVSLQKDYDGALGDITITANRSYYADFTMPHTEGGIACIVPIKYEDVDDVFTFLHPLTKELWLTTAVFYISTAVVIWILSKRILLRTGDPLGQHAGMICYFPFFPGQGIEANLVCLILVTWAFVASLLNSTYTANLSSRLTVARLRPTISDVAQLIRNGDNVGCQEGSFLQSYLVNLRFNKSKIKMYKSVEDCHEDLSSRSISAYCDVLPHIKQILSHSCGKYKIVDPIYRTDGFAFAFPKGFPAVADISRAIIKVIEEDKIKTELWPSSNLECSGPVNSSSPTKVSLRSFLVLFAITGCVTLTCLVVSLLFHLHIKRSFLQRISDFIANVWSRILAWWKQFKQNDSSYLPKTTYSSDEIHLAEMGSSS